MKKIFFFLTGLVFARAGFSQSYQSTVDFKKTVQPSMAIRLPYAESPVMDALKEYMSRKGWKPQSSGGFSVFHSVRAVDVAGNAAEMDLYFQTASGGKGDKGVTLLSLMPAAKNEDIAARNRSEHPLPDSVNLESARLFLDSLAPFIATYAIRQDVASRQEGLNKALRKMNGLKTDQSDLEKRLRNLQSDLDVNKNDQVKAAADLQANLNADVDSKSKLQKKLNKLMDEQGSLEKKIRKAQQELDENKTAQQQQQQEVDKQQQGLDSSKARLES